MTTESMENSFQLDVDVDRNISTRNDAINIGMVNVYDFMDFSYFGTGGYRDGTYLIPFSRESDYQSRKKLAYYKNYVKPILRAMVEPVFSEEAIRSVTDINGNPVDYSNSLFLNFLDNVDAGGDYAQDFIHSAVDICRRHGVVFTVMDNFPDQPGSMQDAIINRIYPYVYIKTARDVESYKTDMFGNLEEITFEDEPVKINGKVEKRYRMWTKTESVVLSIDREDSRRVISSYSHNLGVVPVIVSFSNKQEKKSCMLVDPPLYDLAKLNYVIYQMCAELRDLERCCGFPQFFAQGLPPDSFAKGPKVCIIVPQGVSMAPGYASPGFDILSGLVENQNQIRKDLYTIAEQQGVVGVESSESGIAKSFDFFAHEDTLKRTSSIASTLEYKMSEMFMRYTKEQFIYNVKYRTDFAPMGLDREVDRIDKVLKMPNLNIVLARKLQEKLARLIMSDEDRSVIDEIVDSLNTTDTIAPVVPVIPESPLSE